jgi:hypothetical protein
MFNIIPHTHPFSKRDDDEQGLINVNTRYQFL